MAKVVAEVTEVRGCGQCSAGHRVGDRFTFDIHKTPPICQWALGALQAPVAVLLNGGTFPWADSEGSSIWCCPDATDTVVFRLWREDD